jgi:hypothetical protein
MPKRLLPSDPDYPEMNALAYMLAILKNPAMHLLGYGHGQSPIERAINRACDDDELAAVIQAVEQAQLELIRVHYEL